VEVRGNLPEVVAATAALLPDGSCSVALVNFGDKDIDVALNLPVEVKDYSLQTYNTKLEKMPFSGGAFTLKAQTFAIVAR